MIKSIFKTMDDKKAAEVLLGLLAKYDLQGEERAAVEAAVGILSWTALSKGRLKALKDKREDREKRSVAG